MAGVARLLGLFGTRSTTKFVPEHYLYNSANVRLAVLQGLLDTDGGPVTQRGRTCRVQYTTVSPRLRDDVTFLVRSLGGVAYSRVRPALGRAPGLRQGASRLSSPRRVHHGHPAAGRHRAVPAHPEAGKYRAEGGGGRPMRFIESIEPAGTAEAVCISVAAADSLYTTEDFLLTHNTLNDSFIILDEAQNTSPEQMKMFLTRLGFGSKIVVTGDVTQVDLPAGQTSGLRLVQEILDGVDDVYFSRLTSHDVVRHKLVADIVDAYERYDARRAAAGDYRPAPGRRAAPPRGQPDPLRAGREGEHRDRNESGLAVDEAGLAALARHVLDEMRVHPLAELSVLLVDEAAMADLHQRWMGEDGPTDVLAFPMDELRPPHARRRPGRARHRRRGTAEALLGDVVLCPQVALEQARKAGHSVQESSTCCARTASCTCWGMTTPSRTSTRRCSACRTACWPLGGRNATPTATLATRQASLGRGRRGAAGRKQREGWPGRVDGVSEPWAGCWRRR